MSVSFKTDRDYQGCPYIPTSNGTISNGENGHFNVVQLPSFKLTAQQQASGNVEVIVEDPTGKIIKPNIKSVSGLYNCTFLPERPGDYLVSIRVDDEDIEGSPFYVKVFDPNLIRIIGLRGGIISQINSFSVDTDGIGDGPLVITILHLGTNRVIPAKILQDAAKRHIFHIQWLPNEPGFYRISVQFAHVDAAGSPYTIEVINPSLAAVSGWTANQLLSVGQVCKFLIKVPSNMAVLNEMRVLIVDPAGTQVQARLLDNKNGTIVVEFVPIVVGPHKIDVSYFNMAIKGSPFRFNVFDSSRVRILNWKTTGKVGKSVEFEVDISKAGPGELDINVSGGEAPYKIQEKEPGKYRVTFTPKQPGTLDFAFSFNKIRINGGPWTCTIQAPPTASASGNGVQTSPPIPVNSPATFEVKVIGSGDGVVDVQVTGPNGSNINTELISSQNNVYKYQYTPNVVGTYSIDVRLDGTPIHNSPFSSRAYSPGSVILGEAPLGFVGRVVEFQVDASQAGEGQIEVVVDNGSVANNVVEESRGVYIVSFVPKEAKVYNIMVKFNGQIVKGSPVSVNVLDLTKVTLMGGGGYRLPVNKPCTIKLNVTGSGNGVFTALARAPSGAEIIPTIREAGKKILEMEYTPREVGVHDVEVELEGNQLPINPIQVSAYDATKIRVRDIRDGIVGRQMKILVESSDPGEGDLKFSIYSPNGSLLNNSIEQINSSNYSVVFTPGQQGAHQFTASFNDEAVIGSPFTFQVYNVNSISASGQALRSFPCNKLSTFFITSPDPIRAANCDVKITDPLLKNVSARLSDMPDGTIRCDFSGPVPGDYKIDIKCYGLPIPESPFLSKASDVTKVIVTPISSALVGNQAAFNISVKDAGEGTLEISISNPIGQQIANSVSPMGPGQFVVSFTPNVQGPHQANVTFNEEPVHGSPFSIQVNDPSKSQARGEGLDVVRCNKATSFLITSSGASLNDIHVKITGPKNSDIRYRINETGQGAFKVEYTPVVPGDHVIDIEVYGRPIANSPFTAKCWDNTKVKCTKIVSGRVGVQTSFNLDASAAGEGDIEIIISGPSGQNISNHVTPLGPGLFVVSLTPEEGGVHKVSVTFNQENVFGSPFTFNVIDLGRASARGDGLGSVKVNNNASFVITAPGAQEKDLEVYVFAPNGKEVAYKMVEVGHSTFRVDYVPTVAGDHRIEISYFGLGLPGGPYYTKVWDSSKVIVSNVKNGKVGSVNVFNLDVNDAGEGTLEIGVTSPSGQNIHNNVMPSGPGKFEVSSVPLEPGQYKITVTFNRENVTGSPFSFLATDINKVSVRGDGLGVVRCGVSTSFVVTAPVAQQKDVDIVVVGPDNNELLLRITETSPGTFRVEYTPQITGTHQVKVHYFGQPIPSSPFPVKVWDTNRASINCPPICKVGSQSTISIDTKDAGEGSLEVAITQPSNRPLPSNVTSLGNGRYEAAFVTTEAGVHRVGVLFNKEHISGSPATTLSIDPSKVSLRADGSGLVPCNQPTTFSFRAPAAGGNDVRVKITGPDYKDITPRIVDNNDQYTVEFTPTRPGDHVVEVTYFGEMISGCPFVCKAFSTSLVQLTPVRNASVNKAAHFTVNTSQAGMGTLEVVVSAGGAAIPVVVKGMSGGLYDVNFTPQVSDVHEVSVKFNGEEVQGSPFQVMVIDGSKATASGPGLEWAKVNVMTSFDVTTNNPPTNNAQLEATITNARGQFVPSKITSTSATSFHVEYVPKDAGLHKISLKYAGVSIQGSPFTVDVCDPGLVRITSTGQGIVGRQYVFEVDATKCGVTNGNLEVEVKGQSTKPIPQVTSSRGMYTVSFVASENVPHTVNVLYNGDVVNGSPFTVKFIDPKNMYVNWGTMTHCPVNKVVTFDLEMGDVNVTSLANAPRSVETSVVCRVRDPAGRELTTRINKELKSYRIEFTPTIVGPHTIDVRFGNTTVSGSPHICDVYNANRVIISQVTADNQLGRESSFVVDASKAGQGQLDVRVVCAEAEVIAHEVQLAEGVAKYSFVPVQPKPHVATVKFCSEPVPGSPVTFQVINPANKMKLSRTTPDKTGSVGQPITALLTCEGFLLNLSDIKAEARGASGEALITSISSELDGTIRISYIPNSTGLTKLDVSYSGRAVSGSPLTFDIFDASKVVAEAPSTGVVDQPMSFDVVLTGAGKAPLDIKVYNSRNNIVPITNQIVSYGHRVTYIPKEAGLHIIKVQFGGVDVPGTPIHQQITDTFMPTAQGEGLVSALENTPASFALDTRGHHGNLNVKVEGPRTMAATRIEEGEDGSTKVTYTPIETGMYKVYVKWNDKEINGSPFQVNVTSPKKIQVIGGWESILDHLHQHMPLYVDEKKSFELDCSNAGPGHLRVHLTGPDGVMPTEVKEKGEQKYQVGFIPRVEGPYSMKMYYNEHPLEYFPINGTAVRLLINQKATPHCPKHSPPQPQPPPPPQPQPPQQPPSPAPCPQQPPIIFVSQSQTAPEHHEPTPPPQQPPPQPPQPPQVPNIFINVPEPPPPQPPQETSVLVFCSEKDEPEKQPPKVEPPKVEPPAPPKPAIATGQGLTFARSCEIAEFYVLAPDERDVISATMIGVDDDIPVQVSRTDYNLFKCTYKPEKPGHYLINLTCNGLPINGSPFKVKVPFEPPILIPVPVRPPPHPPVSDEKPIVAIGYGLAVADVDRETEFLLDGVEGDEVPKVTMLGPSSEIPVRVTKYSPGRYRCYYTPNAPGMYLLSITHENRHVNGSPFRVVVNGKEDPKPAPSPPRDCPSPSLILIAPHHDPPPPPAPEPPVEPVAAVGNGLISANLHQVSEFLIDDAKCDPSVQMIGPNGFSKLVPVYLTKLNDGRYKASYRVDEPGEYLIIIKDCGVEVPGSPFRVLAPSEKECKEPPKIDISKAVAFGPGLFSASLCNPADFMLDATSTGIKDGVPQVRLVGASGDVDVKVEKIVDGKFKFTYAPPYPGVYFLNLSYNGYNINGSPYTVRVPIEGRFEPNPEAVVAIGPGLTQASKNKPAEFIVDTSASGPGPVSIKLTGPKEDIPVQMEKVSDYIYRCQYIPPVEGTYLLNISYCGINIPTSPYRINVTSEEKSLNVRNVVVVGRGLVEGEVNEEAEFIIDATQAGPGKPSVKITQGKTKVPCTITQIAPSIYKCTYVPPKEGEYLVFVKYGGTLVPGAPYQVQVKEPPKEKPDKFMVVTGPGMSFAVCGQRSEFLLDGFEYDNLFIKLSCPSGDVPLQLFKIDPGKFICVYTPTHAGAHTLSIMHGNQHIPGSPFIVNVVEEIHLEPLPPQPPPPQPVNVNVQYEEQQCSCSSSSSDDDDGHHKSSEQPVEKKVKKHCSKKMKKHTLTKNVTIEKPLTDADIRIPFHKCHHHHHHQQPPPPCPEPPKCPEPETVVVPFLIHPPHPPPPPPKEPVPECVVVVIGPGKTEAVIDKVAEFIIDGATGEPNINLTGVEGDIKVQCTKLSSSRYLCSYIAQKEGVYLLNIATGGLNVCGSPFKVTVTDPKPPPMPPCPLPPPPMEPCGKHMIAVGPGLGTVYEKKTAEFVIDGPTCESPQITLTGTEGDISVQCSKINEHIFKCSYVPEKTGIYLMNIQCGGVNIPGSPFKVTVLGETIKPPPPSCAAVAVGEGLISVSKNHRAEFVIDGVVAGEPQIICQGPTGPVQVTHARESDTRYKCFFYPVDAGTYTIYITIGGIPVCGSPFTVNVADDRGQDPCHPEKVLVIGPGINYAMVGITSEFILDASAAGKADPCVELTGPDGSVVPLQVIQVFDSIYRCVYTPTMAGSHTLSVAFCGTHIPGSPFKFECVGPPREPEPQTITIDLPTPQPAAPEPPKCDPNKVVAIGPGLSGAQVNSLAEFLVDGCVDSSPMVQIYGSTSDIPVQCSKITDGRFKCSYIPQTPGIYLLSISCCGRQIPGSPFKINVVGGPMAEEPHRVVLQRPFATGQGLSVAQVGQQAEFMVEGIIDCGDPKITMAGTAGDVIVQATPAGDGAFRCTYVPHACGVYLMTVACGDLQVIGSPFKVTVGCDEPPPQPCPVKTAVAIGPGLSDAWVDRKAEFIIDGACDQPDIKMIGLTGDVAVQTSVIGSDRYKCSYIPNVPGVYLLSISCCGFQLPGSPFKVVVPSPPQPPPPPVCEPPPKLPVCELPEPPPPQPKMCVAIGPGLCLGHLNKISEFIIDGAAAECLQVQMLGEDGEEVLVRTLNIGDGRYLCSYMPHIPGEYQLSIKCNGNHLTGSPYKVVVPPDPQPPAPCPVPPPPQPTPPPPPPPVPPPSIVIITPEHPETPPPPPQPEPPKQVCAVAIGPGLVSASLHQVAEFLIDGCCEGEPQILLAGVSGNVPVHALKIGDGRYKCAYTPERAGVYLLNIACNGCQVIGSPFKIVVDEEKVTPPPVVKVERETVVVSGAGTHCGVCAKVSEFVVDGAVSAEPVVKLYGASGEVYVTCSKSGSSMYKCSYIPPSPGVYLLSISYQGLQVPGSPFRVVVECEPVMVQLEPCPEPPKPLPPPPPPPPAPIPVAIGPGLNCAQLNSVAEFLIDGAGPTDPQIMMIGVNGDIDVKYVKIAEGRYKCAYVPQIPGVYLLSITCHGNQIPGSPFKITVPAPCPPEQIMVDRPIAIPFPVPQPQQQPIPQFFVQQPPVVPIIQKVTTVRTKKGVETKQALPPMTPVAMGPGLYLATANQMSEFVIDSAPDIPEIQMHGSECEIFVRCFKIDDYRYRCSYTAQRPGAYMLSLSIKGIQIPGSPFKVTVQPDPNNNHNPAIIVPTQAVKVSAQAPVFEGDGFEVVESEGLAKKPTTFSRALALGPGLMGAQLNKLGEFVIDGSKDEPMAQLFGTEGDVEVKFTKVSDGRWRAAYTITKPGAYLLSIITDGLLVAGSPYKLLVKGPIQPSHVDILHAKKSSVKPQMTSVDLPEDSAQLPPRDKIQKFVPQNVIALGPGLSTAYLGKAAEFMVDASHAGQGIIKAQLVGITTVIDVKCTDVGGGRFACSYTPKVQGAYLLNITWSDQPIPGSPFKVAVMSSVDPSKVILSGDVIQGGGTVGQLVNIMVDTKNAGKDDLKASCKGPNRFITCNVEQVTDGMYNVSFTPDEPGPYTLQITYAGALIPGCPVTIRVSGPIDPSKVVVSGSGIQDGVLGTFKSEFTVETKGAGPGQLTVRMRGRKDTFRIEMKRDPANNRTIHCRYNPTEVGLYILDIKWSGQHVPGSPFKIHLFDTMMELNQFKSSGGSSGAGVGGGRDSLRSNGFNNEFE